MKRIIAVILTALMLSALTAGCTPKNKVIDPGQSGTVPTSTQTTPTPAPVSPSPKVEEKVKETTGIYVGRADTTHIEIKIEGIANPVEFSIEEVVDSFKDFKENDKVKATYIVNEDKVNVIKSIVKVQ